MAKNAAVDGLRGKTAKVEESRSRGWSKVVTRTARKPIFIKEYGILIWMVWSLGVERLAMICAFYF